MENRSSSKCAGTESDAPPNWLGICGQFLAAPVMVWPALCNRNPLLYPDSMAYLELGEHVARVVFFRQFSGYYGERSLLY